MRKQKSRHAGLRKADRASAPPPWRRIRSACNAWFAPVAEPASGTWRYLPHLLLAAFAARAAIALSGDFLLHSDEIMQYLEPAHYAAFGSGVLYWEFVHGARSWLIPGAVAGILLALDAVGLGQPRIYVGVVELAFCLLSLLIPWGMYRFTQHAAGESAARIALVLGCFWYEFAVMAHKPFSEFISTAFFMAALALLFGGGAGRRAQANIVAAGALFALASAVRMHYAPAALLIMGLHSLSLQRAQFAALWGGAGAMVLAVGAVEWRTWGAPFHSYMINYMVNTTIVFGGAVGASSRWQLPGQLLAAGAGLPFIVYFLGVKLRGPARFLLLAGALIFVLHMLPGHREYRFLFLLVPFWLILLSMLLARARLGVLRQGGLAAALFAFGALALANVFPWQSWVHKAWTTDKPLYYLRNQDPMFAAMKYLSARDDVRGVMYQAKQAPYSNAGGYYYLHHDVPFYTAETWNATKKFGRESGMGNFISHYIIEDYRHRELKGFTKVHRVGDIAIWRRTANEKPVRSWRAPHVVSRTEIWSPMVSGKFERWQRGLRGWFIAEHRWRWTPPLLEFAKDAQ